MTASASPKPALVTDTTATLPPELLERWDIACVDLYVGWNGDLKAESSYDPDAFYEQLHSSDDLPVTSQPSVGDFADRYRELGSGGRPIVSIHLASSLSGTCDSARKAALVMRDEPDVGPIEVIDAETGAGGLGLLVIAAARTLEAGGSMDEVLRAIDETREALEMWFCLRTLEFLRRGGRIGAAQSMLGSALKVMPILTFGKEITPVCRVRTEQRAMDRMKEYLVELNERGTSDWIVQHARSPDQAAELVESGTDLLGGPPIFCTQVGPVLGAHLGSGVLVGGIVGSD
jgi:DegV family protein with EDD domain